MSIIRFSSSTTRPVPHLVDGIDGNKTRKTDTNCRNRGRLAVVLVIEKEVTVITRDRIPTAWQLLSLVSAGHKIHTKIPMRNLHIPRRRFLPNQLSTHLGVGWDNKRQHRHVKRSFASNVCRTISTSSRGVFAMLGPLLLSLHLGLHKSTNKRGRKSPPKAVSMIRGLPDRGAPSSQIVAPKPSG